MAVVKSLFDDYSLEKAITCYVYFYFFLHIHIHRLFIIIACPASLSIKKNLFMCVPVCLYDEPNGRCLPTPCSCVSSWGRFCLQLTESRHFEKQIVHSTPALSTGTMPRGRPRKLRVKSNDETGNKSQNASNKKYRLWAIQITCYLFDKHLCIVYNNTSM